MTLQDQCVTLEQAKRLKELGVSQESLFYWYRKPNVQGLDYWETNEIAFMPHFINSSSGELDEELLRTPYVDGTEQYAAFTVAELGTMLPEWLYKNGNEYRYKQWRNVREQYDMEDFPFLEMNIGVLSCYEVSGNIDKRIGQFDETGLPLRYKTEAEARAALLIYLIENKFITPPYTEEEKK